MFRTVQMNLNAGALKNAWMRLNREIQINVEHKHVYNGRAGAGTITRGQLLYDALGNRHMHLAIATSVDAARWTCVACDTMAANGGIGVGRTDGYAYVRFETGLGAMTEGDDAYVSPTLAGAATTAVPIKPNAISIVGVIADGTEYTDDNPYAWVLLGHCCTPVRGGQ